MNKVIGDPEVRMMLSFIENIRNDYADVMVEVTLGDFMLAQFALLGLLETSPEFDEVFKEVGFDAEGFGAEQIQAGLAKLSELAVERKDLKFVMNLIALMAAYGFEGE